MGQTGEPGAADDAVGQLLSSYDPQVRDLALKLRAMVRDAIPQASEEIDTTTGMIGYTVIPGTYRGLILTISPQRSYVNIIFSKGVDLMEIDTAGLLEGTGKRARHIKVRTEERVGDPGTRALIEAAGNLTRR